MDRPLIDIQPRAGFLKIDWKELWDYRDLFYFLVWRDILVRYKQTVLGAAWALIQPVTSMILFTVIFGKLAKISSDGLPYAVFSYSGLIIWTFFAHTMNQSAGSLIADERMITKIYFPRLIIPMAPVFGGLLDLGIAAALLLLVLMPIYGIWPSPNVWALPLMLLLTTMAAAGVGIWLSALNVKYRDFRYVIPFMTQIWMFASPVAYPVSLIPEKWRLLYSINPLVGAIEGFRWALLGTDINVWPLVAVSFVSATVLASLGMTYFRATERFFADVI